MACSTRCSRTFLKPRFRLQREWPTWSSTPGSRVWIVQPIWLHSFASTFIPPSTRRQPGRVPPPARAARLRRTQQHEDEACCGSARYNTDDMASVDLRHILVAAAAALMAGGINSVAGGGTLVSFPTLVWLGLPPITANATSTLGIWPGSLGSIWGFRSELARTDSKLKMLAVSSLIGGGAGAILL